MARKTGAAGQGAKAAATGARGDPKDEYIDVSNNIRHFQTIRFVQPTILIALSAALITVLFVYGSRFDLEVAIRKLLQGLGLLGTISLWHLQERTMLYWYHFMNRAVELEKELGFRQYSTRPAGILAGSNAMRGLFLVLTVFWLVALVWMP